MRKNLVALGVLATIVVVSMIPVHANVTSTIFEFPVVTQTGSSTAFNQDNANALDTEFLDAKLPIVWSGLRMGPPMPGKIHLLGFNFDAIDAIAGYHQSSDEEINSMSTNFAQTSENSDFAYPFTGVGTITMPGFNFGF